MKIVKIDDLINYEQDYFCGQVFGQQGQLEVTHTYIENYRRYYIVKCRLCSEDSEKFGSGHFVTQKVALLKGMLPCGCAPKVNWNEFQWELMCSRQAKSGGVEFLGWFSDYKGGRTKCRLVCKNHGEWTSTDAGTFVRDGGGCPTCRYLLEDGTPRARTLEDLAINEVISKCDKIGIKFIGWAEDYRGLRTKCKLECSKHGIWETTDIEHLCRAGRGHGCPGCKGLLISNKNSKSEDYHTNKFMDSGYFPEGTVFKRGVEEDGLLGKWEVYCPICKEVRVSTLTNLSLGKRPCSCVTAKPDLAYIHLVLDGATPVGVKFGITSNANVRLTNQRSKSIFEMESIGVWKFQTYESAKSAEKDCMETLECGIFSRQEIPDGFTETTWVKNIEKIIKIYNRHGGKKINELGDTYHAISQELVNE